MRPRLGKAAWRAAAGGPSRRGPRAAPRSLTVQLPALRARRHRREAPAPRADPPAPLTWQRRPSRRRQVRPATQRAQDAQTASAATLLRARALRAQPRRRRPAETASCPPRSAHRQPNRVSAQRKRRFQCALCSRVAPLRPSCALAECPGRGRGAPARRRCTRRRSRRSTSAAGRPQRRRLPIRRRFRRSPPPGAVGRGARARRAPRRGHTQLRSTRARGYRVSAKGEKQQRAGETANVLHDAAVRTDCGAVIERRERGW